MVEPEFFIFIFQLHGFFEKGVVFALGELVLLAVEGLFLFDLLLED